MLRVLLLLLLGLSACAVEATPTCSLDRRTNAAIQVRSNLLLVNVRVNGQDARMVLDTGSPATVLSEAAVARLGLPRDVHTDVSFEGAGGSGHGRLALAQTMALGGLELHNQPILVGSFGFPRIDARPIDGLLSGTFLSKFDADLDPGAGVLTLYTAGACPSAVPPWSGPYVGVAADAAQLGHLIIPIELDGFKLRAVVDTGASFTLVSTDAAALLGVSAESLAAAPAIHAFSANTAGVVEKLHRFRELKVSIDTWKQPILLVGSVPSGIADVVLGGDYLDRRRVWLSKSGHRMFVTFSAATQSSAPLIPTVRP